MGARNLSWMPCWSAAEVSVDRETGQVTVHKLVVGADPGRALNKRVCHGQVEGAAIQAFAQALFEELRYRGEAPENATPLTCPRCPGRRCTSTSSSGPSGAGAGVGAVAAAGFSGGFTRVARTMTLSPRVMVKRSGLISRPVGPPARDTSARFDQNLPPSRENRHHRSPSARSTSTPA